MGQDFCYIQHLLMKNRRSITRFFAPLAFVLFVAAALGGCGSSGSTTSALTKAGYHKKADAICKEAEGRREASFLKAWHSQSGANGNAAREKLIMGALMPPIVRMNKELEQLQPPSSEAAMAKRLVSSFDAEIKTIEANPISVFTGKHGQFTEGDEVAIAIGLNECSEV